MSFTTACTAGKIVTYKVATFETTAPTVPIGGPK
jgi:hypothetical protein